MQDESPTGPRRGALAPAGRPSIEVEAARMGRGRGRQVIGLAGGTILLVAVGIVLAQRIGQVDAHGAAFREAASIGRELDAFFVCALPSSRVSEQGVASMQSAFERLGSAEGKGYGETLRGCLPLLTAAARHARELPVPPSLEPQHALLVTAVTSLVEANAGYLDYLSTSSGKYDQVTATPLVERYALAWDGYRAAHRELIRDLQAHR